GARVRLDEVVPGVDRTSEPADLDPRPRDACARSAGRDSRRAVGRDRRCGRRARLERCVLPVLGAAVPAHPPRARAGRAARGAARRVKVLIVSGIWPPDVGGPASHAPDVASYLQARGHDVEVVTTADAPPEQRSYPVRAVPRHLAKGVRHYRGAALVHHRARENDVVYTTGMFGRSALGSSLARAPYVVKLTADPAFERSRRTGLVGGNVDEFQRGGGGVAAAALRLARDVELRRAAHVFCPSTYLRELAIGWGVAPELV